MMAAWTLHTGLQGARTNIAIEWTDHNFLHHRTDLEILIQSQDKPRTLVIRVNGVVVHVDSSDPLSVARARERP